ncbi:hypothetical protein IMZ48_07275 [Candidatus Bathyarchaeota archaeon]|nr:hypothetical protein [Candidatus Bathyarchaeota archaeon]
MFLARLLLGSASPLDGGVDVHEALDVRDPNKSANVLNRADLLGVLKIAGRLERGVRLLELLGVGGVDVELATLEGGRGVGDGLNGLRGLFRSRNFRGARKAGDNLAGNRHLGGGRTVGDNIIGGLDLGHVVLPAGKAGVGGDETGGRKGRDNSSSTHDEGV